MKLESSEKGFDRGAWLTLAAMLLFAIVVVSTTLYILRMPGDGWQNVYEDPPLTDFLGSWPTPLQVGDVVLAVNGEPVDSVYISRPDLPPDVWHTGSTVTYTIERDGRQRDVDITLEVLPLRGVLLALANTMRADLAQWSWFIIGLIVFILRPRSAPARLLFIAGSSVVLVTKIGWAATMVSANFAPIAVWNLQQLADVFWGWLFFPSLILLMLVFPQPLLRPSRFPRLIIASLFLIPLAVSVITFVSAQVWPATLLLVVEAVAIFAVAIAAVVQAYRNRQNRVVRAQVSWVALGVALTIGGTLVLYLLDYSGLLILSGFTAFIFAWPLTLAMPVCLAIAILRYRLFDIDFIIRKTLQYTVLTGLLLLIYFGSVIILQNLIDRIGGEQSPLVVVISTLIIAALFNPLRRRVQEAIDRRFFRRKYDTQAVLTRFSQVLRNETDIEVLSDELLQVVHETLEPVQATLWLRRK